MLQDGLLLVEDYEAIARKIIETPRPSGIPLTWLRRLIAVPTEGNITVWGQEKVNETIDLASLPITIALVDSSLGSESLGGSAILPRLVALGVLCFGISDDESGQLVLLRAGAHGTLRSKSDVVQLLLGKVSPSQCRWPEGFDGETHGLEILTRIHAPFKPVAK